MFALCALSEIPNLLSNLLPTILLRIALPIGAVIIPKPAPPIPAPSSLRWSIPIPSVMSCAISTDDKPSCKPAIPDLICSVKFFFNLPNISPMNLFLSPYIPELIASNNLDLAICFFISPSCIFTNSGNPVFLLIDVSKASLLIASSLKCVSRSCVANNCLNFNSKLFL